MSGLSVLESLKQTAAAAVANLATKSTEREIRDQIGAQLSSAIHDAAAHLRPGLLEAYDIVMGPTPFERDP